jgi:RNA recognition motif-containing protein
MTMNIYVGNLPFRMTADELEQLFQPFGRIERAKVITDPQTGKSRGFGFVEFADRNEGQKAVDALNGKEVGGRAIRVNEARRPDKRHASARSPQRPFKRRF